MMTEVVEPVKGFGEERAAVYRKSGYYTGAEMGAVIGLIVGVGVQQWF